MLTQYENYYIQKAAQLDLAYLIGKLVYEYRKLKGKHPTELCINNNTLALLRDEMLFGEYSYANWLAIETTFLGMKINIVDIEGNNKFNIYYEVK